MIKFFFKHTVVLHYLKSKQFFFKFIIQIVICNHSGYLERGEMGWVGMGWDGGGDNGNSTRIAPSVRELTKSLWKIFPNRHIAPTDININVTCGFKDRENKVWKCLQRPW